MKGFTIIELMLVVAILGVISSTATPFLSNFLVRNNRHVATDRILSEIYKAQSYAMSGKEVGGSAVWGVCLTGGVWRMFNGSCLSPNQMENYTIPNGVTVSGVSSVTFNTRGEPSSTAVITVASGLGNSTITLGTTGMVDVN